MTDTCTSIQDTLNTLEFGLRLVTWFASSYHLLHMPLKAAKPIPSKTSDATVIVACIGGLYFSLASQWAEREHNEA